MGFDIETDLWCDEGLLFLGHDKPEHIIDLYFLSEWKDKLWIHSKNFNALNFCLKNNFNTFYHTDEDYVLTSNGHIWAYTGKELICDDKTNVISVLPDKKNLELISNCYAICTDEPTWWKNNLL